MEIFWGEEEIGLVRSLSSWEKRLTPVVSSHVVWVSMTLPVEYLAFVFQRYHSALSLHLSEIHEDAVFERIFAKAFAYSA